MKALELEEAVSTIDDSPHRTSLSSRRRRRRPRWVTAIAAVLLLVPLWVALPEEYSKWPFQFYESEAQEDELILGSTNGSSAHSSENIVLPQILMEEEIYDESNFINAEGIAPPYWNTSTELFQNSNAWGPCFKTEAKINWQFYSNETRIDSNTSTWNVPLVYERDDISKPHDWQNTAGLCRPGFLILGAGKCGTSSLYHYLVGHPRVLPAVEKQIHYFKYHTNKPIGWYYSWFPTTETFLENGALMTGEASPGYLPYPQVVRQISNSPVETKMITLGRNPIDRIWSSYNYNYIAPALDTLRKGLGNVPMNQSDDFYRENYLFSLEELVRAELDQLNKCIYDFGIQLTWDKWYSSKWTRHEFDYRQVHGLPPLIDLDEVCYGKTKVSNTVLREQWTALQTENPEKFIPPRQAFLIQAIIGRSLYVLPLEWWYIEFDREDLIFVCTEELSNATALLGLARQLGLPDYDFEDAISQGAYNVGGHRGYDTATSWNELKNETQNVVEEIPLSTELRQELEGFLKPFNERLFSLVGKRCDW